MLFKQFIARYGRGYYTVILKFNSAAKWAPCLNISETSENILSLTNTLPESAVYIIQRRGDWTRTLILQPPLEQSLKVETGDHVIAYLIVDRAVMFDKELLNIQVVESFSPGTSTSL